MELVQPVVMAVTLTYFIGMLLYPLWLKRQAMKYVRIRVSQKFADLSSTESYSLEQQFSDEHRYYHSYVNSMPNRHMWPLAVLMVARGPVSSNDLPDDWS